MWIVDAIAIDEHEVGECIFGFVSARQNRTRVRREKPNDVSATCLQPARELMLCQV